MKALSLWQPWASLIADGRKKIETRHWAPPPWLVGSRLAIHAAQRLDRHAAEDFGYALANLPRGAVVCTVLVQGYFLMTDVSIASASTEEKTYGDFSPGRFGWTLGQVEKFSTPIPLIGRQGIFNWDYKLFP